MPKPRQPRAVLEQSPALYRAQLSCRVGRDAIEGKIKTPEGVTPMEWAMFNLLHAVEDIVQALADATTKGAA